MSGVLHGLTATARVSPPTITGFSPTSLSNGTGNVTVTGTNFVAGGTTVTVGGTAASSVTVNSTTSMVVAFPSKGRGTYSVVATTPSGSSPGNNFTYTVTPSISSISPSSVQSGTNQTYTVAGSRFSSSAMTAVNVSGVGNYSVAVDSDSQFRFTANLSTGSYTIVALAPDGNSNGVGLSITAPPPPAPTISSVSDGRSGRGSQTGSTITVSGANFTGASVSIGGVGVSASVSASSISFTCPNLSTDGTKTITVSTTGGSANTSVTFWGAKAAVRLDYTTVGSGSVSIPNWVNGVDVAALGGGGSGDTGGAGLNTGAGGNRAVWATASYSAGSIPASISYSVGAGGAGPAAFGTRQNGFASSCGAASSAGGLATVRLQSGRGQTGESAVGITFSGVSLPGGTGGAVAGGNAGVYGSGGGGGNGVVVGSTAGGSGSRGYCFIRYFQ